MHRIIVTLNEEVFKDLGEKNREELAHLWQEAIKQDFVGLHPESSIPIRWIIRSDYHDGGDISLEVYFPVSSVQSPTSGHDELIDKLIDVSVPVVSQVVYSSIGIDVLVIPELNSRSKSREVGSDVDP
ncbi:MAG TPA: hypothetical protein VHE53_04015 [Patescibacteria group bacterium]|nr:hypothetical protein [Patescibacteria group bacterium]